VSKRISRIINEQIASGDNSTVDALRAIAGYPLRSVEVMKHRENSRIVEVRRDQFGNIIGSVERLQEFEFEDFDARWTT